MTQPSRPSRPRLERGFLLCLVGPLAIGVAINALIRPGLARLLGGEQHSSGASVRSHDTWWTFDPVVVQEHPVLTTFLTTSDGVVGVWILGGTALLLTGRWLTLRYRSRRNTLGR